MPFPPSSRCQDLSNITIPSFILSLLIVFGIITSYLPQHFRIIKRRTSDGISPRFVLLGVVSATLSFANILTLPTTHEDVQCCHSIPAFACASALLGIAQIGAQFSCFVAIMILFSMFPPSLDDLEQDYACDRERDEAELANESILNYLLSCLRDPKMITFIFIIQFSLIVFISGMVAIGSPNRLQTLANIFGASSAVLACVQYLPQIHTTWLLQDIGSLSIPMMCIQVPGSFIWAFTLALRFGLPGWSVWSILLLTGTMQAILLAIAMFVVVTQKTSPSLGPTDYTSFALRGDIPPPPSRPNLHERARLLDSAHGS